MLVYVKRHFSILKCLFTLLKCLFAIGFFVMNVRILPDYAFARILCFTRHRSNDKWPSIIGYLAMEACLSGFLTLCSGYLRIFISFYSCRSTFNSPPVTVSNRTVVVEFLLNNTGARYSIVPNWVTGNSVSNRVLLPCVNVMRARPGTL
mgnify:CR=1 FL=1